MCGICGHTRDPAGRAVRQMNGTMVHRGPDDHGVHVDESAGVGLGARRLSIIDPEGGHQPLSNEDGSVWAVLNGEIYNHETLRAELRGKGHQFASRTDTEVLVHLYEEQGAGMVEALDGMFAFAVWDARRQRLLLARDRFGEKPLFYTEQDGHLRFASELTALLCVEASAHELDPAAVDDFFVFGYVTSPRSIYRGVRQLAPATLLEWSPGRGAALERYWAPSTPSPREGSTAELVAEARDILRQSIRTRLMADVPVGVFLSGGVDSTLVAALAAETSNGRVKTFTVGYDVGVVGELAGARRAATALDTDHHEVLLRGRDVARDVPRLMRSMDQPIADQALVALRAVAEFARPEVTVAIGGEGADEIFGGYPRYRWLRAANRMGRIVPRRAGRAMEALAATVTDNPKVLRLGRIASGGSTLELHLDWVTAGRRALREAVYGPRLSSCADPARILSELREKVDWDAFGDPAHAYMALDQTHWLPDDVLAKADRATMLASLEMRTPYLKHELAELTAAAPGGRLLGTRGKAILRGVLEQVAPELASPPKTAFRVPAADWLRGPLAGVLDDQLATSPLYGEGWFHAPVVERWRREHAAGSDRSSVLWPLMTLGLWLEGSAGDA